MVAIIARLTLLVVIAFAPVATAMMPAGSMVCAETLTTCQDSSPFEPHTNSCCAAKQSPTSRPVSDTPTDDSQCGDCGCCVMLAHVVPWSGANAHHNCIVPLVEFVRPIAATLPISRADDVQLRPPIS